MTMETYTETQPFRQWWIWTVLLAATVISFSVIVLMPEFQPIYLVLLVVPTLLILFFYITRLDTHIDASGVRYRFFPFINWRTIAWADIRSADVRTYPFVGYGIRWDFDAWYYIINGNWGLHIERSTGRRLVIGTQRPDELRPFLKTFHPALVG